MTVSVTATNTQLEGTISLTKNFVGEVTSASFYLKDNSGNYYDQSGNIVAKGSAKVDVDTNGEVVSWVGLPLDTPFTIEEDPISGYSSSFSPEPTYTITESTPDLTVSVTATNTQLEGNIEVKKTCAHDTGSMFSFTVTGPYSYSKSFELKDGQSWTSADIPIGNYTVKENDTGYLATVKVDGTTVVNSRPTPVSVDVTISTNGSKVVVEFDNDPKGTITLTKSGLDDILSGDYAGFTLYYTNGVAFGGEQRLTGNGTVTWSGVPYGTGYYIRETHTPVGYNPIADITGIDITYHGQLVEYSRTNTKIPDLGSIALTKTGLDSTDVAGFTLYNSSGAAVVGERRITGNDTVTWSNLPFDTYRIVETTVPSGYTKMADITGIVVGSAQQNYSFSRTNSRTRVILGSITLAKSGLDSTDVAGFTLYNSSGATVGGEIRITGNNTVTWSNLPFDTYRIVETTVPSGYTKMDDITGIVVGSAQQNYSFSRTNSKTPPPPGIEVLGISELPFTGMNPLIPLSGMLLVVSGIVLIIISVLRRKKRNLKA